jgi:hypothetical protein
MRELWRVPSRNRLKSLMSEPNALPSIGQQLLIRVVRHFLNKGMHLP